MIEPKDSSTVFVDVTAYNSKNYYLVGEFVIPGRLPVTGTETILDAINFGGGLTPRADHKNVVLYRHPKKGGSLQVLRIDVDQIMMGDDLSTNYQLLPGDRLVVPRDPRFDADPAVERRRASPKCHHASTWPDSLFRSIAREFRHTEGRARHSAQICPPPEMLR